MCMLDTWLAESNLCLTLQTWSMFPVGLMEADVTPVWNDTTLTLISGVCWETCRQHGKERVSLWLMELSTASVGILRTSRHSANTWFLQKWQRRCCLWEAPIMSRPGRREGLTSLHWALHRSVGKRSLSSLLPSQWLRLELPYNYSKCCQKQIGHNQPTFEGWLKCRG